MNCHSIQAHIRKLTGNDSKEKKQFENNAHAKGAEEQTKNNVHVFVLDLDRERLEIFLLTFNNGCDCEWNYDEITTTIIYDSYKFIFSRFDLICRCKYLINMCDF